jgi:hypothetical protein
MTFASVSSAIFTVEQSVVRILPRLEFSHDGQYRVILLVLFRLYWSLCAPFFFSPSVSFSYRKKGDEKTVHLAKTRHENIMTTSQFRYASSLLLFFPARRTTQISEFTITTESLLRKIFKIFDIAAVIEPLLEQDSNFATCKLQRKLLLLFSGKDQLGG